MSTLSASPFFFLRILPPPRSTLFPYTTLFRSFCPETPSGRGAQNSSRPGEKPRKQSIDPHAAGGCRAGSSAAEDQRSEEHTSELQSRVDLVCRLLLEKKKTLVIKTSRRHAAKR